jgi:hypothetical protein
MSFGRSLCRRCSRRLSPVSIECDKLWQYNKYGWIWLNMAARCCISLDLYCTLFISILLIGPSNFLVQLCSKCWSSRLTALVVQLGRVVRMELRQGWRLHCCPPLVATSKRSLFSHMDIMDADGDISLVHIQYMILHEFTSLSHSSEKYASKIRLTALENSRCAFFIFFHPRKRYYLRDSQQKSIE